jgi:uncharacterized protein
VLALVAVVITAGVYGTVALIVKMDDIGLHLVEKRHTAAEKKLGRALLIAMPRLLAVLSTVGTVAMLWVGGDIILHGSHTLGLPSPYDLAHAMQHTVEQATGALGAVLGWVTYAGLSALVGLVLGALVAFIVHKVFRLETGTKA